MFALALMPFAGIKILKNYTNGARAIIHKFRNQYYNNACMFLTRK